MAIPHWLWPAEHPGQDGRGGATGRPAAPSTDDLRSASSAFDLLSDPARLEILAALSRSEPRSYTELRDATSIDDNGRLNYHLRALEGLLERDDDGYALSESGRRLFETVRDGVGALD